MITADIGVAISVDTDGNTGHFPVKAEAVYDPADPLAVKLIFHPDNGEVVWIVSRELLLRGVVSLSPYGGGDFKMRYEGEGTNSVIACLMSNEGHVDLRMDHTQMVEFLNKTTDVVRFGDEDISAGLDEFLEEVLDG